MPLSVPYTTAASSFLYGLNTVLAALKAKRRNLYHLYVHGGTWSGNTTSDTLQQLARDANIPVQKETNHRLLDKMSGNRPHNGIVLEASKLPAPPVYSMALPQSRAGIIPLDLARQSAEDVNVNGAPTSIPYLATSWRHPFVVMLDGVLDEGNLGNILRTCHFYGVDAVAVSTNTCAPLNSPILAKASSGACEAIRILALPKPSNFVYQSAQNGWQVFAAVAPDASVSPAAGSNNKSSNGSPRHLTTSSIARDAPLSKHPCILMLGAEGEGLRKNLQMRADYFVSIPQGQRDQETPDVGVESLNVAVAAGVLIDSFLLKPDGAQNPAVESELGF